jgi:NAD(P)-dependent dehydrogenase (short-subunit alcohol dehydrogenase family)
MKIKGSVALVTGANRGLGRAYAAELVSRGAARSTGPRATRPRSPSPA